MKIFKLSAISPAEEQRARIPFNNNDISLIFGNVTQSHDKSQTINSIGKTLALSFINIVYGRRFRKGNYNEELKGYTITAEVEFKGKIYNVSREIGSNAKNFINAVKYTYTEYLDFFQLNRSLLNQQIHLEPKSELISNYGNITKTDYEAFLIHLELEDIASISKNIYELQDDIKKANERVKQIKKQFEKENKDGETLDERIFYVNKQVEELEKSMKEVSDKIRNIETSNLKSDTISQYNSLNKKFKALENNIVFLNMEIERLEEYLKETEQITVSSKDILNIFQRSKIETPEMVQKRLEDVEKFNMSIIEDRKNIINSDIKNKKAEVTSKILESEKVAEKLDNLGKIISENKVYQEQVLLYDNYSREFSNAKFLQGELSEVLELNNQVESMRTTLMNEYSNLNHKITKNNELIQEYREYVYNLVKYIYEDRMGAYFSIESNTYDVKRRPLKLILNITGEEGEGLSSIRKLLIDLLIFKFSNETKILIEDSSCFNGIDSRQILKIFQAIKDISKAENKQAFVSINKFQLEENDEVKKFISNNSVITLSEDKNLLGFTF